MSKTMELKKYITLEHHAHLICGEREGACVALKEFLLEKFDIKTAGNPDFYEATFATFGIDEGRELKERQSRKPVTGRGIFLISAQAMTTEAQNSLLKVLEEPAGNTHFFFVLPHGAYVLPTLRSRFAVINMTDEDDAASRTANAFFAASPKERIASLGDMIERKDKEEVHDFFGSLERFLYAKMPPEKASPDVRAFYEELRHARSYATDRSANVKMLLEHVALAAPKL